MVSRRPNLFFAIAAAMLLGVVSNVEAGVLFSSLNHTLLVTAQLADASNSTLKVASAGVDTILVKWSLNASAPPGIDDNYSKVNTKLCFAPVSQLTRKWRKNSNDLSIDKTCSFDIATQNFSTAGNSVLYLVSKTVPYAEYFVRAYVLNVEGNQVAYGQSTNANKTTNIFTVDPITGRHATIDVAVAVMSVFSVASLFTYYVGEQIYLKRKKSV
ncbi:hypothetical protein BDL97_08G031800 [Sphagnum fallax]|jgi:hypothetical protein|nr:hypothetical protein BDL97_08G031800 [Sphagnum fallax]KAH8953524.1 hypothetical protein BDL97_08G031800 [Sphagnum fallax]